MSRRIDRHLLNVRQRHLYVGRQNAANYQVHHHERHRPVIGDLGSHHYWDDQTLSFRCAHRRPMNRRPVNTSSVTLSRVRQSRAPQNCVEPSPVNQSPACRNYGK